MKRYAAALCAFLLVLALAAPLEAATAKKNQREIVRPEGPPLGIPELGEIPDEFYLRQQDCTENEHEILDGLDQQFLKLSAGEPTMDSETQKFLMMLMEEREMMSTAMQLYRKCGRIPETHPLETDPKVLKEDLRQIEEYNRRNSR